MSGQAVSTRGGARAAFSVVALSALSALPLVAHADETPWLIALTANEPGACPVGSRLGQPRPVPLSFALKPVAAASSRALCAAGTRAVPARLSASYADIVNDITLAVWRTGDEKSPVFAVGLQGGKGTRSIVNRGTVDVQANATVDTFDPTLALPAGEDSTETLSVSATAVGIGGGSGKPSIDNRGAISAKASASVDTVAVTLTLAESAHATTTATIGATAIGIDGGGAITNDGTVLAQATASSTDVGLTLSAANLATASGSLALDAKATGIRAGRASDGVVSNGSVTATATAEASGVALNLAVLDLSAVDAEPSDLSTTLSARSVGIDAGDARNGLQIGGAGRVSSIARVDLTSVGVSLSSNTGSDFTENATARTSAVGVSGSGPIANRGEITASATSSVTQVGVTLTLVETAHATTTTTIEATAVGIDGSGRDDGGKDHGGGKRHDSGSTGDGGKGHGSGLLANEGTVLAQATASTTDVAVTVSGTNFATADTSVTLDAKATGIRAGHSTGKIVNTGPVTAIANAELIGVDVSANFVDLSIVNRAPSDASTTLTAGAIGIDARKAKNGVTIDSAGSVTSTATTFVNSTGVSVGSEGVSAEVPSLFSGPIAKADITATSRATGVRSGVGGDNLTLAGPVTVDASATAQQQSVDVGIGVFDVHVPTPGISVVSAGTKADARAAGVATDGGNDRIELSGAMKVNTTARSHVTAASVSLADLAIDLLPDRPSLQIGDEVLAVDAITEAKARVVGIDAGKGDDTIVNRGSGILNVGAVAKAGSLDLTARLGLKYEDQNDPADPSKSGVSAEFGVSLARTRVDAKSVAAGIDGGEGRDMIVNEGMLSATADARTQAVLVRLDWMGPIDFDQGPDPSLLASAAASDASNSATAKAVGVAGGAGDDIIVNRGHTTASATAKTLNVTAGVSLALEKNGALAGVVLVDSDATATARAVGLDGGAGADRIENTDQVDSTASATATSVSATVAVQSVSNKGLAASVSVLDADTTATATAVGLRSGDAASAQGDKHDAAADARRTGSSGDAKACASALVHTGCTSPAPELRNAGIGIVNVDADAANVAVNATAHVNIAKQGAAVGVALSDTSATAVARATGIEGDGSGERFANEGAIGLTATSKAVSVGVNFTVEGAATGLAGGAALTRSAVDASATAIGIAGGGGDDEILNTGSIATQTRHVQATATTVGVAGEPTVVTKQGAAIGAALTDTRATSSATVTGIDGGEGDDQVLNRGDILLTAIGSGTTAVGVSLELALAKQGFAAGAALARADAASQATVSGIAGGAGDDTLVNEKLVSLKDVRSDSNAVSASLVISGAQDGLVIGAALAEAGGSATTTATGMAGGAGRDTLANRGTIRLENIEAESDSVAVGVDITVSKNGLGVGAALVRSGVASTMDAMGLSGGAGKDVLINERDIDIVGASANADAVGVSFALAGSSSGVHVAAALADGSSTATATARGLDGGAGDDVVVNRGHIGISRVRAGGHAASVGVGLAGTNNGVSASVTLVDSSATATARAIGIDGGSGRDELWNQGDIQLSQVKADAGAVSVGVGLDAAMNGVAVGAALARARSTADVRVVGIDAGSGDDRLGNKGSIVIDGVKAKTNSVGVTAQLGVTNSGVAIGAALADVAATARSGATGLDGGAGDDGLVNTGQLSIRKVKAEAGAVSVGVTLTAAISAGVAAGVALTDASGTATVDVIGMAGGDGRDTLVNLGSLKAEEVLAKAHATGVSVTLSASMAGVSGGASLANSSATARANVTGLAGGAGDDTLHNKGGIDVQGKAVADALSLAVQVSGSVGVAGGAAITDASGTASAAVTGVDGGSGRDEILNEGSVHAASTASASSASISVSVNVGVGGDVALADARSTSSASAVGIQDLSGARDDGDGPCRTHAAGTNGPVLQDRARAALGQGGDSRGGCPDDRAGDGRARRHGGDGEGGKGDKGDKDDINVIVNRGDVIASADATSKGTSVSVGLHGFALGETTNTANSNAAGIRTDAGRDLIRNEGALMATSRATATGLAVAVDLAGKSAGDASSTATAGAVGIDTGARDDDIENHAAIAVDARSNAGAKSFAVGLIGANEANASITSNATAVGIAAGDGHDRVLNVATVNVSAGRPDLRDGTGNCTEAAGGACAQASTVSVQLAGFGASDASSTSNATARGLDGGSGDDELDNGGTVTVGSLARSRADGTSVTLLGASDANAASAAHAGAVGLLGGVGRDLIVNRGAIDVSAAAETFARGAAFTLVGSARAASSVVASASVVGIDGGTQDDTIRNSGRIEARSNAELTSHATSFSFAGSASTSEFLVASSSATGIAGGDGDNVLLNEGGMTVSASAQLNATGGASSTFGGVQVAASATARADAAGMSAAGGNDVLVNDTRGSIVVAVTTSPRADNDAAAGAFFVEGVTNSVANSTAGAFGLNAGDGENLVVNRGAISVTAGGKTEAHSRSDPGILASLFGLEDDAYANSTAVLGAVNGTNERPTVEAVGIAGGAGRDRLTNEGGIVVAITTSAYAYANANGEAIFSGDGSANAIARANDVEAAGIRADNGDNIVHNRGTITVDARPVADADSLSDADGIGEFREPDSRATTTVSTDRTRAFGIQAGGGENTIVNEGAIVVTAAPQADRAEADADYGGDVLGIDAFATSTASADSALAVGVLAEGSRNVVLNQAGAAITVRADPRAVADASARGGNFDGDASSWARASADGAQAIGIRATGGENHVVNDGKLDVSTLAYAHAKSIASPGTSFWGDGEVEAYEESASARGVQAIGIWASGARDTVRNRGSIVVDAQAAASLLNAPLAVGTARSEASAFGIRTGDGIGELRNEGDLHVTALSTSDSVLKLLGITFGVSEAVARATGIGAGNGGNHVLNTGSIRVEAIAIGNTSATAEAVGIRTGSGDDTIVNRGTIVATQAIAGVTTPGVAIDAGAGNDRVVLGDGSVTTGTIDLGIGSNTLVLEGTPVINGGFVDGQSTLTLGFLNSGSYAGALPGVAAVKDGAGTFTLAMLNPMERIEVRQGSLRLARDYRLLPQGTFDATVYGDGTHGQFRIGGQAQLAGRIGIVRGGGPYVDSTTYDVLVADGGIAAGSTFDRIDLPAPTRLVSFSSAQQAGAFSVTADVKSFTTVADGRNAQAVARQLDRVLASARGDLRNTLGTVQGLATDAEFATAYASLSPATYGQRAIAGAASANRFGQALEQRLGALQAGARGDVAVAEQQAGLVGRVGAGTLSLQGAAEARQARPYGLWVQAFAQKGDQDSTNDVAGYRFDLAGRAIGIDHRFSDAFIAGAAYGWVNNEFKSAIAGNTAGIDSRLFALYSSYTGEGFYANGTFSVGRTSYDSRRTIVVGATSTPVTSEHDAKVIAATLGAGLPLRAGGGWVDPFANLRYTQLKEDGFSESGSGSALAVEQRKTRSVVSEFGVRWTQAYAANGSASVSPEASVAWLHDFGSGSRLINAAYLDAPDASFAVEGQPIKRNGAKLGLGMTYRSGSGLTTQLRYSAEVRQGYRAHGIIGELRYEF